MTQYRFCEKYKDGISFKDIHKSAKACGGVLREIAHEMFLAGGYTYNGKIVFSILPTRRLISVG